MSSTPFRYEVSAMLEQNPEAYNRPLFTQFENLVAAPLRKAGHTLPSNWVVVIDALDECHDNDGVDRILDAIFSLISDLPIKFFLTSRPNPMILDRMRGERAERVRQELQLHELEKSLVLQDITTYLREALKPLKTCSSGDIDKLAKQSGVLFIHAATAVRYIGYGNFSRGSRRLKQVLDPVVTPDVNPNQGMDELYTTILRTALDDENLNKSERAEIWLVLCTVICAQEPLTVNVTAALAGLDLESVQEALRPLFSMLQLSQPSGSITTLHESFPNYLLDQLRSKDFHCDVVQHNARLAQSCFKLIRAPNPPFNICMLESSYLRDREVVDSETRIRRAISHELFYACRYFGAHLGLAEYTGILFDDLHDFLSVRLLLWMEILNLKKLVFNGAKILFNIQAQLQKIECPTDTKQLARDAWKFVTTFCLSPASECTPHIYVSALPFWPGNQPVSTHFMPRFPGLVKPSGTAVGRRVAAPLMVLPVSSRAICIAQSPIDTIVAVGCEDGAIRLWDVLTSQLIETMSSSRSGRIKSLAYSPDGSRIASVSSNGVHIWDVDTGQLIEALEAPFAFMDDFDNDYDAVVWLIMYLPGGSRILVVDENGILIWDTSTRKLTTSREWQPLPGYHCITAAACHTGRVNSVTYSPSGIHIVSSSEDRTIRIWHANTGQMLGLHHTQHPIRSVLYSSNGSYIIAFSDNVIWTWDSQIHQVAQEPLAGHNDRVSVVAYSPDGARLVSGSWDQTICVWDSRNGDMIGHPLNSHACGITSITYFSNGIESVAHFNPNNPQLGQSGVHSWDEDTRRLLGQLLERDRGAVIFVENSQSGTHIISESAGYIRICGTQAKRTIKHKILEGYGRHVESFAYSPNGQYVAFSTRHYLTGPDGSLSSRSGISLWDMKTKQTTSRVLLGDEAAVITSLAASPDGAYIASGSSDKNVCIWDVLNWRMMGQPLAGHTREVLVVTYSPDGAYIASGSADQTIRIWGTHSGQLFKHPLKGHTGAVTSIAFSPDGTRIASGSSDCAIRIWDLRDSRQIYHVNHRSSTAPIFESIPMKRWLHGSIMAGSTGPLPIVGEVRKKFPDLLDVEARSVSPTFGPAR
ncbi:hypothetical protein FRC12_011050 [Ceratobasidium sp. 428]|nr:hypothetical protein FRC12_011050 [Ceratobasidium sp. 428]